MPVPHFIRPDVGFLFRTAFPFHTHTPTPTRTPLPNSFILVFLEGHRSLASWGSSPSSTTWQGAGAGWFLAPPCLPACACNRRTGGCRGSCSGEQGHSCGARCTQLRKRLWSSGSRRLHCLHSSFQHSV